MVSIKGILSIVIASVFAYVAFLRLSASLIVPSKKSLEVKTAAVVLNATDHPVGGTILQAQKIQSDITTPVGNTLLSILTQHPLLVIVVIAVGMWIMSVVRN